MATGGGYPGFGRNAGVLPGNDGQGEVFAGRENEGDFGKRPDTLRGYVVYGKAGVGKTSGYELK